VNVAADRKYTKEHEWVIVDDGVATVGISDYAQDSLGEVMFINLPGEGAALTKGDEAAAIESSKAATSIYAAGTGTVTEINPALVDDPTLVNSDCYGRGWVYRITVDNAAELDELMDAAAYEAYLAGLDE